MLGKRHPVTSLPLAAAETEFGPPHILLVAAAPAISRALADQLRDAGLRVTTARSFGLAELLAGDDAAFDLLLTTQTVGEMAQFGLPQLARSIHPDLPIVVLDHDSVGGGVLDAVHDALLRWPLRDRPPASLH